MCTLVIAYRARADAPLIVAANRDELYARPSAPPRIEPGPPRALMPVDLQQGGTWLGLNEHGLFAGITNRAGGPKDPARKSRGLLVREALHAQTARGLHAAMAQLDAHRHNGFHLAYADRENAYITWSDGARLTQLELRPGVHVVTERSFGAGTTDREPMVVEKVRKLLERELPTPAALRALLSFHGPPDAPLDGACVHGESFGYGTRSSFQLVIKAGGAAAAEWTEGPPCTSAANDLLPLLEDLSSTPYDR